MVIGVIGDMPARSKGFVGDERVERFCQTFPIEIAIYRFMVGKPCSSPRVIGGGYTKSYIILEGAAGAGRGVEETHSALEFYLSGRSTNKTRPA